MLSKLVRRIRYLLGQDQRDRSLAEEIRSHLDLHAEELVNQGLQPEAADYAARRRFGNSTLIREDARAVWIARWFDEIAQDLRYGLRSLRRQPGFTAVAVLSASLGIGTCCTIFGIANFALFRTLHNVAQPDSLVSIFQTNRGEPVDSYNLVNLAAGTHTAAVVFHCFSESPGTCYYYGSTSGVWEYLHVLLFAQP